MCSYEKYHNMYSSLQSIHEPLDLRNSSYWLKKRMISFLFGEGGCDLWSNFAALTACCLLFLQVSGSVNGSVMILSCYIFCQLLPALWTIVSDCYTCVLDYSTSLESDSCSPNTYSIVSDCYTCVLDYSTSLESDCCSPNTCSIVSDSYTCVLDYSTSLESDSCSPNTYSIVSDSYTCVLDYSTSLESDSCSPNTYSIVSDSYTCVLDNSTFLESDSCSPKNPVPLSLTVILVWSGFWLLPTPYSIVSNSYSIHVCSGFWLHQHPIPLSLTVTFVWSGFWQLPTPYSSVSDSYTCVFWNSATPNTLFHCLWQLHLCVLECSTSLGSYSYSPSALFVASDGPNLRLYQAVIDARLLLTESKSSRANDVSCAHTVVTACFGAFSFMHSRFWSEAKACLGLCSFFW